MDNLLLLIVFGQIVLAILMIASIVLLTQVYSDKNVRRLGVLLHAAIAEGTDAAKSAYAEANTVNDKIERLNERLVEQNTAQEHRDAAQERRDVAQESRDAARKEQG